MVVIFMITFYTISTFLSRIVYPTIQAVNRQEEVVNGLLFEIINNIRTVKVMGMASALSKAFSGEYGSLYSKIKKRINTIQSRSIILETWGHFFRVGIFIIIIKGILNGHYEVGFLVLFMGYYNSIWMSVSELSDISQEVVTAKLGIARMKQILDEPVTIDQEIGKQQVPSGWQTITFENVSFAYGENEVLKNISFTIKRGERIGVVGLSGAGKSTIFKLLLKENESYTGRILIDGISLREINKRDYYKRISVVLQDTEVFNFTLRENIAIVNQDETNNDDLFNQSLKISHVDEFLHKLPNGVLTLIGEKGVKLSGGEKQRLGIARAIFKQPEILLLDEATSHLDIESEEIIRDSLHQFFQSVTAIVIAHRLTTIKEMDRILVIEGGELIESGTFEELHKKNGRFHELWEKQRL
jgi:ABC-type multidrug transport system fused ATPase/permease subunit